MSQKSKTTSAIDPKSSALIYANADRANNLADSFQPYTGQLTAGFNEAQREAQQGILDFSSQKVGSGLFGQARDAAGQSAGYQPMNVNAAQLAGTDLSPYMNPYQSQVIDNTLSQYDRQNQIDMNNARGRATQAGAFGGSGAALLQAQMGEANGRTLASTLAGLNNQNFSQAQSAAQGDIAARNQAAGLNQQAGLQGNAQRMQASGILSGLSDQERAQGLQNWQLESAVGDTMQQQQQSGLDAQHNAYLEWLNTQLQGQNVANSGLGSILGAGTTTGTVKSSPGLSGILGAAGGVLGGVGALGGTAGLKGIL